MSRDCTLLVLIVIVCTGCGRSQPDKQPPAPTGKNANQPTQLTQSKQSKQSVGPVCDLPKLATRYPAAARVVAIGDVHGDAAATRRALRLAGAIDAKDTWIGGKLVVVQLGDVLDRGDGEQEIMDLLEALRAQAKRAGGAVHVLNGNHETMNARGDFTYVTPGGFADFEDAPGVLQRLKRFSSVPESHRARTAAFAPGGPYAQVLARHNTVAIVGDALFVHGGVMPRYARYGLEKLNAELRCWLAGKTKPPRLLHDPSNPLWSRAYSIGTPACAQLKQTLDLLRIKRMVVAHTVQAKINAACNGMVWRIDTGMAAHYGGVTQVLELTSKGPRVLKQ